MTGACEALVAGASAGVAPALRAVDCMASEMAAGAFSRLFGSEGGLLPALTILLTLYIAFFAFALITGRSRIGVSVLTPRMLTLGLVLTFATSWMAWQQVVWNLAVGAPDQIAGVLMGTRGSATVLFADRIDMVVGAIAEAGGPGDAQGAVQNTANNASFSPQGAMWMAAMLLLLGTVGVLVTARIVLAVLLATGPVFVVMGLFAPTRGLTAGWIRGLVMAGLTPLFVTVGGSLMLELAVPVVAALRGSEGGIDARAAMALFVIAAVHCALMTIMFRVAGTMVAGWNVFGLGQPGGHASGQSPAQSPAKSPLASVVPAYAMGAAPGALSAGPARGVLLAQAAAPPHPVPNGAGAAAGAAGMERRTIVARHAPEPGMPLLRPPRARGIGSRFAAPRPPAAVPSAR